MSGSSGWVNKTRCLFRMEYYPVVEKKKKKKDLCTDREGPSSALREKKKKSKLKSL